MPDVTIDRPVLGSALLTSYGFDSYRALVPDPVPPGDGIPARVLAEDRKGADLISEIGELRATVASRLRRSLDPGDHPSVGDWVLARPSPTAGWASIERVLARRSAFMRLSPDGHTPQVIAANVDIVFIVDTLDREPNLRRIERYLVVAWESGASPVVILSKADQCEDVSDVMQEIAAVAAGTPIHATSVVTGTGLDELDQYLQPGRTAAFIGPSGVGKSTLVNHFCGAQVHQVGASREFDGKGRHTTTGRHLVLAPSGALFIDTPGLRELQLWDVEDGISRVFGDIEDLAAECRFSNCSHDGEPGCAVLAAAERGELDLDRLDSYLKLEEEAAAEEARRDKVAALQAKRETKVLTRAYNAEINRRTRGR
jgi:ribosome biogenesis GTPase / thiamine phosphate phosphatase